MVLMWVSSLILRYVVMSIAEIYSSLEPKILFFALLLLCLCKNSLFILKLIGIKYLNSVIKGVCFSLFHFLWSLNGDSGEPLHDESCLSHMQITSQINLHFCSFWPVPVMFTALIV